MFDRHVMMQMQILILSSYDWQIWTSRKCLIRYVKNLLQEDNFICNKISNVQSVLHWLTSWKSFKTRFCVWIISSTLSSTIFVKFRISIAFHIYTKNLFDSLSANSVLLTVIMMMHCIQKYELRKHKMKKFEDLKVMNKCHVSWLWKKKTC